MSTATKQIEELANTEYKYGFVPDYVHVLADGRIVRSGGRELALELEDKGYAWTEPALRQGSGQAGARK